MEPSREIALDCPAKVNLSLSIGSPLANGFHPLASWMVAVQFADQLRLAASTDGASHFHLAFDAAAPVPSQVDWPLNKDLAFRAHGLLEAHVGRSLPINATLLKRIPTGSGLGGGSSDAAAMLVGVNQLFSLGLDAATLRSLGQKLGSDVGFLVGALLGTPSAIVTGLGETLEPTVGSQVIDLVLIFPGFGCPTGEVYHAFDQLHAGSPRREPELQRVRALARQSPVVPSAPFNDLAAPACVVRPELGRVRERVASAVGLPVHITGSGSRFLSWL